MYGELSSQPQAKVAASVTTELGDAFVEFKAAWDVTRWPEVWGHPPVSSWLGNSRTPMEVYNLQNYRTKWWKCDWHTWIKEGMSNSVGINRIIRWANLNWWFHDQIFRFDHFDIWFPRAHGAGVCFPFDLVMFGVKVSIIHTWSILNSKKM